MGRISKLNHCIAVSPIGRYFKLDGSPSSSSREGTKFTTEVRAGIATFITMAYIISVNATIIADSGGPCKCTSDSNKFCIGDESYEKCLETIKHDLITATALISCIGTAIMGIFSNLPIAIGPGMGLNAYFTYTVVGYHGSGKISYQVALAAVFLEGLLYVVLSIFGIRQYLARIIPSSIKLAAGTGIGLFLAFIGLQKSTGIGLITYDPSTLVTLGGCPQQEFDSITGRCLGHQMESATTWLGILGFIIMSLLMLYKIRGSVLIGIILISIISWFRNTAFTYFPNTPQGNDRYEFFQKVVNFFPIQNTLATMKFDFSDSEIWIALMTFLYVDMLDTTGTLYSIAKFGGFIDNETGDFEGSTAAFICDAISISIGAVFGTSPVTAFVESSSGISEGGRTGITALVTSICFGISIFFIPIFASIPPWATGPALMIIGSMMLRTVKYINWEYIGDSIPAFLTIVLIPLTYNVAYGLIAGIGSYFIINTTIFIIKVLTKGKVQPSKKSFRDNWGGDGLSETDIQRLSSSATPVSPWLIQLHNRLFSQRNDDDGQFHHITHISHPKDVIKDVNVERVVNDYSDDLKYVTNEETGRLDNV
ncbi:5547_t:CDS:1 [Funneliformis mosseae]|uniref:5547_t:CDS:1 n=1 Tax=Funneliformis mosseae TaxID=27381 RepID=A0A9N8ZVT6_FUNMO|nr:5547_t:CDS:1 [Funneliformis mosseae]